MTSDDHGGTREGPSLGETASVHRDWTEYDRPTTAVIEAAAAATGRDPTALPPLQNSVDTDALDSLFGRDVDESVGSNAVTVSFTYDGVRVLVDSDGDLTVHTRSRDAD